ncbi:hypothetical protein H0H92_013736 [Tricholoma furcatifolium]|nr:hypothetical protein H0H92_013736 [Tricholoma furcatifolium]
MQPFFTFVSFLSYLSFVYAAPTFGNELTHAKHQPRDANLSQVAAAWYSGWDPSSDLTQIPWSKYTILTYSFAETSNDENMISLTASSPENIPHFVDLARQNGVKALISVGGWTGSEYFSSFVTSSKRAKFVTVCQNLVSTYDLDGLDFDWEFPNDPGAGNQYSPSDTSNYIAFLSDLRTALGSTKLITLSVGTSPLLGSDGNPLSDVSSLAGIVSYVAIMDYDVYGPFSPTTGPNSPLDLSCAPKASGNPSATSAVTAWTDANMPANQIVLGVASYGHTYSVPTSEALSKQNTISLYTGFSGPGTSDGQYTFAQMISAGLLTKSGNPANGIYYLFDNCSQTPFVYDKSSQVMVSYDNAQSFAAKGKFISDNAILGFAMWDAAGDSDNILIDAITSAM